MARSPVENLDFENLSDGQLRDVIQHAREQLGARIQARLDEFQAMATEAGFSVTIAKIGEGTQTRRRRRSSETGEGDDRRREVAPKYRNPANAAEEWSGRGRRPKWVEEQLAAGKDLPDLRIQPPRAREAQEAG
jgi:DNA-binding protein H-NS